MATISIKPAQFDELSALARIGEKTFRQTFASSNDPDDFEAYLDKAFALEQLSIEMNDPETSFSFAKVDHNIVGYLKTALSD